MTTARVLAALGLWCGHALVAVRLDAQGGPPHQPADSTFLLATNDPARTPSPFIGNGRVGIVIPALGLGAEPSLAAGLYEHGPGDVPRIAAVPSWSGIGVFAGDRWLGAEPQADGSIQAYRQTIDMRTGTARTSYDWVNGSRRTQVRVETFISRAAPGVAAIRIELGPHQAGRMRVRFALAGWPPPHRLPLDTLQRTEPGWGPAELWYPGHMVVRSRRAAVRPGHGVLSLTASPEGRTTVLGEAAEVSWPRELPGVNVRTRATGDTALVEVTFDASAGRTYSFLQLVGFVSSEETAQPLAVASRRVEEARSRGYDSLAADNARAWARRWETDIVLDGDPALQRVVRSMLFYLLCSADSGTALGIPPMGLSSAGYYGHIFWDSDTWMFPALVLTHPDVARSMVDFRARTLPAARANARANGYRGAQYPWEADEIGSETTPHFAAQNASSEIHVNGDVALAQWQYYLATGDSSWLARTGFPVIRGTADFWVSRAAWDSAGGRYHIRKVVSVAEGLVGVNDDAYTNAVARRNLEIAAAAAKRLGVRADPRWTAVAAKLHMPIDSASGFFRTYEGAPDSTLGVITPLLAYPLGVAMSDEAKRTYLGQAVGRLQDEAAGAMMGITLLSVDAAELGDRRLVDSLLPFSYQGHLRGPFLMLSETPTNDALSFLTGAGGFLQQVIFGYTGLRLGERGLEPAFPPVLPSRIRRLVLRNLHVRGRRYDVVVDSAGRHLQPHDEAVPR
jgi:trehalose/maltose hydrolase-like predicted phosphorylase